MIKIRSQFNIVFILIMLLAFLSFFTAKYFVNNVSTSYESIIDDSLPIIRKSGELAQTVAQIESHLIQIHFDANNNLEKNNINYLKIEELIKLWRKIELLLNDLIASNITKNEILYEKKKLVNVYIYQMPQLFQQISLVVKANKLESKNIEKIETIANYNNKILLVEMESMWKEKIEQYGESREFGELEYSYQFYQNSTQLLSYFRQAFLTNDIKILNSLKRNSVILFKKMEQAGLSSYEYKLYTDTFLSKVKPLYAGKDSLFKVRYDLLRLKNVTHALIEQQIDTAKQIENISDSILILIHNSLAQKKAKVHDDESKANQYLIFIIVSSFIIIFFTIWFLVNKNLIKRITQLRFTVLELAKGNTDINIKKFNKDEIGDMEKALTELKSYVVKAKHLSTTDSLTGLLNNSQFKDNLQIEIKRHSRQKAPLSLAMIDIDYFKNYNDAYGHPMGDICLKKISNMLKETCKRAGEYAYRIGGEEFAILMPNTTAQEQLLRLQNLQHTLLQSAIEHKESDVSRVVTISIGIYSCIPQNITTADEYYKEADIALYQAKKDRNKIIVTKCNN